MSADNTIVIGKFGDKYRVAHVQAAENLEWEGIDSPYARDNQYWTFLDAPEFDSVWDATELAFKWVKETEEDGGYVEYGVHETDFGYEFPSAPPPEPNWN